MTERDKLKVVVPENKDDDLKIILEDEDEDNKNYNTLDINQDGKIDQNEIEIAQNKISELSSKLKTSLSGWRKNKIRLDIDNLTSQLPQDDSQTKTY